MLKKTKVNDKEYVPYSGNPDIFVTYELEFNSDIIKPGDKIRFKGGNSWFVFQRVAHNKKIDSTWIDCKDSVTGEFRAFHVYKLKEVSRPKKSRRKRAQKSS